MELKEQIALYRRQAGLSIEELAKRSGVPLSTVKKISAGVTKDPQVETLRPIAYAMGKTLDDFKDKGQESATHTTLPVRCLGANIEALPPMHRVPLLGSIACGAPITAEENVEDYVNIPADLSCQFVLRCKGDSMAPRVMDGDLVYIRQQPDVEDGQIAAVVIDGEATLKHVYHIQDGVQLVSDNPAYRPMIFNGANSDELRIVGLAVAYQRML